MEELMLIINFIGYTLLMGLYGLSIFALLLLVSKITTECINYLFKKFEFYAAVIIFMFTPKKEKKEKCEHKNYHHYFQTGSKYYVCKDCEKWLGTEFYKVIHKREQEEIKKTKQYIENLETIENE